MAVRLDVTVEHWPIAGSFRIARGAKTEAVVVVAELHEGRHIGRGECVPYARYGETVEGVAESIRAMAGALAGGVSRSTLQSIMPAGAARNALDCALWDLDAKRTGRSAAVLAGLPALHPVETAFTLSLGTPDEMAKAAAAAADRPLLKVKLGGDGDPDRIAAVQNAAPRARLIVDANEAWSPATWVANMTACRSAGVELIEQPLPSTDDALLATHPRLVPICADESFHTAADVPRLAGLFDAVNIKLDKTGGLTEALAAAGSAHAAGLKIMVGCMVGTSLAMAPALLVAQSAQFVDLDGPLLLARDRVPGLAYSGSTIAPPSSALWG
jgi:L-alanine-DL-glutamate epimerase-like enolase superfamily enzyme